MEPTLELSNSKAYVNVKLGENATEGKPVLIVIYHLAILIINSFQINDSGTERCSSDMSSF